MSKRKRGTSVLFLALLLAVALSLPHGETAQAATPRISTSSVTLEKGSRIKLKVYGTKKKVKWSSNRKSVATVSKKGMVRAKARGSARITAKFGKKKLTCRVAVKAPKPTAAPTTAPTTTPEEEPRISAERLTLNAGDSRALWLTGTAAQAEWYSTDESIATVSNEGVVRGIQPGLCRIYAEIPGRYFMCAVTVYGSVTETLIPSATQAQTPIPTIWDTPTNTPTPWPTAQPTQAVTLTPTITPAPSPTTTATPIPTPTAMVTHTPTPRPTSTETPMPTATNIPAPTPGASEKFDAVKAKNSLTYETHIVDDGVVVIVKNNYNHTMSLDMDCLYYNSSGVLIGKNSDSCYGFEQGREAALYVLNPHDANYNYVKYSRYAIEFRCEETSAIGNANNVLCTSNYGEGNLMVTAKNLGQRVGTTSISVLFYKNGRVIGYEHQYANINSPLQTDYLKYGFPYDLEYNPIIPDNFKVFVNASYRYEWE